MSIPIFSSRSTDEFKYSRIACSQLIDNIKNQTVEYVFDSAKANQTCDQILKAKKDTLQGIELEVREKLEIEQVRAMDIAQLKGASSWLSALPLDEEKFNLNKREFCDAVRLRYRWPFKRLPSICPCSKAFDVDHALNCPKGGFVNQRHNLLRNLFTNVMSEVHRDVTCEPQLMPLTGEVLPNSSNKADDARADISVRSFWQDGQKAFFDVKVFNPFAQTHLKSELQKNFEISEKEKKKAYNQRIIQLEHGTFSPLVFSVYGGSGRETEHVIRTLCTKVARKRNLQYSQVINWFRTKISIELVKGAILCIRGSRDWRNKVHTDLNNIELIEYL